MHEGATLVRDGARHHATAKRSRRQTSQSRVFQEIVGRLTPVKLETAWSAFLECWDATDHLPSCKKREGAVRDLLNARFPELALGHRRQLRPYCDAHSSHRATPTTTVVVQRRKASPCRALQEIVDSKRLAPRELEKAWAAFMAYDATVENSNRNRGNPIIYHSQMAALCETRRRGKPSLSQICANPDLLALLDARVAKQQAEHRTDHPSCCQAIRRFNTWRVYGCISVFKPSQAAYLYQKYRATHVLDPTAGWGGRALGAIKLGIHYSGFDTNIDLKPGYEEMLSYTAAAGRVTMTWMDCLKADFSAIDYDFVLTSPPFENLEVYAHAPTYNDFYGCFLIPLLNKCRTNIKRDGYTAFHISPHMYKTLVGTYHYEECHHTTCTSHRRRPQPRSAGVREALRTHKVAYIYYWRPMRPGAAGRTRSCWAALALAQK